MRVLGLLLGIAIMGSTAGAVAIGPQNYTFNFTGDCEVDCVGQATGALQLQDYILGDIFTSANFVSFLYSSSFTDFEILAGDLGLDVEGVMFGDGTGAAYIANNSHVFFSGLDGFWCVDNTQSCNLASNDDAGFNARWETNGVPEPSTFLLVGAGLTGLWFLRRSLGPRRIAS